MAEARKKMRGGIISAVNLSEVYCLATGANRRSLVDAIIGTAQIEVFPFDRKLASLTASLEEATRGKGISFADRACLALGLHEQRPILTSNHGWDLLGLNVTLEFFRPKSN